MSILRFESEEALRFTVTSGLVPEDVLAEAAHTWRDAEGMIVVAPTASIPAESMKKLSAAGVGKLSSKKRSDGAKAVRCWAELVEPRPVRDLDAEIGLVVFLVPDGASMTDLAGELLRLGCDRLEWRATPAGHLLRAASPPYYSLLRAIDDPSISLGASAQATNGTAKAARAAASGARPRAFVPAPKGQDRVWVAIGFEHPLARFLKPEEGSTLFVGPEGFVSLPDGVWNDMYGLVDLRVPGDRTSRTYAPGEPPRLAVKLRLARAGSVAAPALWVLREDAIAKVERLLASLPEEAVRGLLFAACEREGETVVVIRARPGARASVEIDGEAYRAHGSIANLYLPCEATLEPPLRRDRVRDSLAPDADDVVWLRPAAGSFQIERAPDATFQPLSDWVEYIVDRSAAQLIPWVKSTTFDFAAFVGVDPDFAGPRAEPREEAAPAPKRKKKSEPEPEPARPAARTRTVARREEAPRAEATPLAAATVDLNAAAEELATIEKDFLVLEVAADDPTRLELWQRMGALNAALKRDLDAALCWSRTLWEDEDATEARRAWSKAAGRVAQGAPPSSLLALDAPARDHVRALAVGLITGEDEAIRDRSHDASLWLDRHDGVLDVRTAWLARVALSRLVGGDRLGLARARDRILGRIHRGLSLERDVPSFMRRAGSSRDAAQVDLVGAKLDALLSTYEKTKRKRSTLEADTKLTNAYVRFVFGYGNARLGRTERAAELRDSAVRVLPADEPLHALLSASFTARIGQALEGLPSETPLPAEISARLNSLAKLERYKVDRIRQSSTILEPHERLDPIAAFQRGEADPRGPEFAELRGVLDPIVIEAAVVAIMAKAKGSESDERARLYDGVMDFFPAIAHDRAVTHLHTILAEVAAIPAPRRVQLLEEALMLAGHFGEEPLARKIFAVLEPLVTSIGADGAAEIAPLASGMLRTLRRFGLREEAGRLLEALQAAATGKAVDHIVARLHTAAALAFLGDVERARPVFDEALVRLGGDLLNPERLKLTRALARALGAAPIGYAIAGLDQLQKKLELVTDSYNTNTHVCLSVVDFMESLVLGYVSDDLTVDHTARRFLDEDEYLVRRRIHTDLTETR